MGLLFTDLYFWRFVKDVAFLSLVVHKVVAGGLPEPASPATPTELIRPSHERGRFSQQGGWPSR